MSDNTPLIFFGMCKLFELINQKDIDVSETIDTLNQQLKDLDVNSEQYIKAAPLIKDMILELKTNKENSDRNVLLNKCFAIQEIINLGGLLDANNEGDKLPNDRR
jgi:hypothetical protein